MWQRFSNPTKFYAADREAALDKLHGPLVEWIHRPSSGKQALLDAYASLTERQRAALAADVERAFVVAHGRDRVTAYRYRSTGGWGGASLSTVEPTWLRRGSYQAVEVTASDVMVHWAQPDLPLGGKAFGHERELILKPDARPQRIEAA